MVRIERTLDQSTNVHVRRPGERGDWPRGDWPRQYRIQCHGYAVDRSVDSEIGNCSTEDRTGRTRITALGDDYIMNLMHWV